MDKKPYIEFHADNFIQDARFLSAAQRAVGFELFLLLKEGQPLFQCWIYLEAFSRGLMIERAAALACLVELKDQNIFYIELPPGSEVPDPLRPTIIKAAIMEQNKAYAW